MLFRHARSVLKRSAVFATLTAAIVGFARESLAASPEVKQLTVMATSDVQIGGPWIVARDKKFFAEEGLTDVDLKLFSAAPLAFPSFASGQVQVMSHAEQAMLSLLGNKVPLKVIGIYADMTGLHGMVAKPEIQSAKDLEGKTIGVQKGSPLEWYVRSFCKTYGCDISKINLVNMPAPEGASAIVTGTIDAYAGWQPFIRRSLAAGASRGLHLLHYKNESSMQAALGPKKLHTAYSMTYVSDKFLQANPNTVSAILRVLDKSIDFIKKEPDAAAAIIATELKTSKEDILSDIDAVRYGLGISADQVKEFQSTADLLFAEKLIKEQVDFAKIGLDTGPLKQVKPASVTFNP